MDASTFYSKRKTKTSEDIDRKLEAAAAKLKANPLPVDLPHKLLGPSPEWRVFKKQDEALNFASSSKIPGLMTFAFEQKVPNNEGCRAYLVSHPSNMYQQQSNTPAEKRCTYEIIPENAPCKLYFDLEFQTGFNPDKNAVKMVDIFNSIFLHELKEEFNMILSLNDILVLDATTEAKFSQHLVYQFPKGTAFKNNRHAGEFIKKTCQKIMNKEILYVSHEDLGSLFVKTGKESSGRAIFCDLGVYTKNRNFRLYKSTKFGKNAPFLLATNNRWNLSTKPSDEETFFASLISYFPEEPKTLLEVSRNFEVSAQRILNDNNHNVNEPKAGGYNSSPWPKIDEFINNLVHPGRMRRWVYFDNSESLVCEITGNRFCENIGRWHKSNKIKYVVNLKYGTFYQSCFDPDCQDFKSEIKNLPTAVYSPDCREISKSGDEIPDEVLAEIVDAIEFVNSCSEFLTCDV